MTRVIARAVLAIGISLALFASTGASASWLSCAMTDQVMPNGSRCACVHEHEDSAMPTIERLPCCTSVEIARTQVPPSSASLHLVFAAPTLVEISRVTRAPLALVHVDMGVHATESTRFSTGPPIPIRLRHLLI